MKHKVFTVFDEKAQAYLPIFMFHREQMAMRVFSDTINSKDHQFGKHPADYTLFEVGVFDDASGRIEASPVNRNLGNGITYVRSEVVGEFILENEDGEAR